MRAVVMQALLNDVRTFERDYMRFVEELVFGEPASFNEARSVFIDLADRLISAVPASPRSL